MKSMFDNLTAIVSDTLTDSIKMIDIDELHDSKDNFFVMEKIEEFAHTILGQGGVKDNLIVRPLESGGYEIISGHRRKNAVQFLLNDGENISRYLPCLVQEYVDEEDKMLDLILMNVSSRQLSDSEMWKSYETIDNILKNKKEKGEYFGRLRDDIAKTLGVSSAQVGKMQNVDKNAIEPVKSAVANGELSISTANEIAKLDKENQVKIVDDGLENVKPKDIKKKKTPKSVDTNINKDNLNKVDTSSNDDETTGQNIPTPTVDTNINDNGIKFRNAEHAELYEEILDKMKNKDVYHTSVAYLLSLDEVLTSHIKEVFNFKDDSIIHEALSKPWQTDSSRKTTRLIYNLWNGYSSDGETYTDDEGYELDLPSHYYAVDEIFCCAYARYYWQAIKLRFSIKER